MAIVNGFLSYLLLFVIMVVIAVAGAFLGIFLAKKKNAKIAAEEQANTEDTQE